MRILVAGATGAVGRHLLPRLVAAGHQVVGTTRTEAKAPLIRQLGGEALVADGLDAGAIQGAVQSARPDAIVHEMTDLPGAISSGEPKHQTFGGHEHAILVAGATGAVGRHLLPRLVAAGHQVVGHDKD